MILILVIALEFILFLMYKFGDLIMREDSWQLAVGSWQLAGRKVQGAELKRLLSVPGIFSLNS